MKRALLLLGLLLLPSSVFAEGQVLNNSTCTCEAVVLVPQTSVDGTQAVDLAAIGFYVATSPAALAALTAPTVSINVPSDPPPGATATWNFKTTLVPGQYYITADAVDTGGNRSGKMPTVPFELRDGVPPAAPSNLILR